MTIVYALPQKARKFSWKVADQVAAGTNFYFVFSFQATNKPAICYVTWSVSFSPVKYWPFFGLLQIDFNTHESHGWQSLLQKCFWLWPVQQSYEKIRKIWRTSNTSVRIFEGLSVVEDRRSRNDTEFNTECFRTIPFDLKSQLYLFSIILSEAWKKIYIALYMTRF